MAQDNAPARRHFEIGPPEEGGSYDREHAGALLAELESVLAVVGGTVTIVAQRRQYGELGDNPLAFTERLVVEWRAHSPLPMLPAEAFRDVEAVAAALQDETRLELDADELQPFPVEA